MPVYTVLLTEKSKRRKDVYSTCLHPTRSLGDRLASRREADSDGAGPQQLCGMTMTILPQPQSPRPTKLCHGVDDCGKGIRVHGRMGIFFSILMSIRGGFALELRSVGDGAPQCGMDGSSGGEPVEVPGSRCQPRGQTEPRSRTRALPGAVWTSEVVA